LPPKPEQDFNELFGFKYDPVTQNPVSGVSPEGKIGTEENKGRNSFDLHYFIIGVDCLHQLLSFDHRLRPTAEQALSKLS
jgi:hypothetical protein